MTVKVRNQMWPRAFRLNFVGFIPVPISYDTHVLEPGDQFVSSAWKQEYHGDAHKILIRAMDELHMLPFNYLVIMLKLWPLPNRLAQQIQDCGNGRQRTDSFSSVFTRRTWGQSIWCVMWIQRDNVSSNTFTPSIIPRR